MKQMELGGIYGPYEQRNSTRPWGSQHTKEDGKNDCVQAEHFAEDISITETRHSS